jgi:gp6-like head-tail connector protein
MADRIERVITPATSYDLVTLDELKIMFGINPTDTSQDELLGDLITQYSDVIATICNRVFAYEEVEEIWRCVDYDSTNAMTRIFLSHYPLDTNYSIVVDSPTGTLLDPATYAIEFKSGKIELLGTNTEPIRVVYSGGYRLPDECPPALKQASLLMIREGQALMQRLAVSGVRSISHKESRVMYFDSQIKGGGGTGLTRVTSGANSLLSHYIRLEV